MIANPQANPEKFNALIVKKNRSDSSGIQIKLKDHNIQSKGLLGIKLGCIGKVGIASCSCFASCELVVKSASWYI